MIPPCLGALKGLRFPFPNPYILLFFRIFWIFKLQKTKRSQLLEDFDTVGCQFVIPEKPTFIFFFPTQKRLRKRCLIFKVSVIRCAWKVAYNETGSPSVVLCCGTRGRLGREKGSCANRHRPGTEWRGCPASERAFSEKRGNNKTTNAIRLPGTAGGGHVPALGGYRMAQCNNGSCIPPHVCLSEVGF